MRQCKLYALATVFNVEIELQKCPRCPANRRRYIGPDLRSFGIFNYNNSILVTHELLDYYTSCYTTSETPFSAWVIQTTRVYANVNTVFMGQDLFRAVWFSYAYIQNFVGDMVCDECDTYPDTAIFDGITLAFGKKHLRDSLRPPTITHPDSLCRPAVKYFPTQQLIPDKALRLQVRSALDGPPIANLLAAAAPSTPSTPSGSRLDDDPSPLTPTFPFRTTQMSAPSTPKRPSNSAASLSTIASSPATPVISPSKAILKQVSMIEQHIKGLQLASAGLRRNCPPVAKLFDYYLGPSAYARRRRCPGLWRSFFKQIAAEESVVQMVNWTAWRELVWLLENGLAAEHQSRLLSVPILFRIFGDSTCSKEDLREIIKWIEGRTRAVFKGLVVDPQVLPEASPASLADAGDWRKVCRTFCARPFLTFAQLSQTGSFYSLPVRRHRPTYPKIRGDGQKDQKAQREELKGEGCRKYYEQYVQRGLTGGIMVCWCTHSICYGFHCIPASEGRDDVFSALITRWPQAPKRVIYDYACALGPYCMLREPQFFANTFFNVDHFHAAGHVKCSPATSFSEYVNVDPTLAHTNSSAAECANSGLKRIRKSTSYMTQERAIIYTKIFLSIWNRGKKLRMLRERGQVDVAWGGAQG